MEYDTITLLNILYFIQRCSADSLFERNFKHSQSLPIETAKKIGNGEMGGSNRQSCSAFRIALHPVLLHLGTEQERSHRGWTGPGTEGIPDRRLGGETAHHGAGARR